MKKILVFGVLTVLPFSPASYGQFLGEGTGGYVARNNGPTGATGGGHHEPMGFGLLATKGCWADATVGCNATPSPPEEEQNTASDATPAPDASKGGKKKP
jgi:hypothetical protein